MAARLGWISTRLRSLMCGHREKLSRARWAPTAAFAAYFWHAEMVRHMSDCMSDHLCRCRGAQLDETHLKLEAIFFGGAVFAYRAQLLSGCLVGCRSCRKRTHKVLTKYVEQAHTTQPAALLVIHSSFSFEFVQDVVTPGLKTKRE